MEQFKIDHFLAAHPGVPFPPFETLDEARCAAIRRRLGRLLDREEADPLELVRTVAARADLIESADAEDSDFSLSDLLEQLGIKPLDQVLLNWYRFDKIDRFSFSDLSTYFDDIWYPSSDDVDVFDETLGWILSSRTTVGHLPSERPDQHDFRTNGVTDRQTADPNGMARLAEISAVRTSDSLGLWTTGAYKHDGSGNVWKTGSGVQPGLPTALPSWEDE